MSNISNSCWGANSSWIKGSNSSFSNSSQGSNSKPSYRVESNSFSILSTFSLNLSNTSDLFNLAKAKLAAITKAIAKGSNTKIITSNNQLIILSIEAPVKLLKYLSGPNSPAVLLLVLASIIWVSNLNIESFITSNLAEISDCLILELSNCFSNDFLLALLVDCIRLPFLSTNEVLLFANPDCNWVIPCIRLSFSLLYKSRYCTKFCFLFSSKVTWASALRDLVAVSW